MVYRGNLDKDEDGAGDDDDGDQHDRHAGGAHEHGRVGCLSGVVVHGGVSV